MYRGRTLGVGEPDPGEADAGQLETFKWPRPRGDAVARASVPFLGLLSVAYLWAAASGANAQTAGASVTPPAGTKRFSADLRSNVAYASNISGGDSSIAAIRRIEPSDVTYGAGATLKFQLPTGRNVLFLTAAADARRHDRNKVLDGEDYQISAGAGTKLGPCNGLLGATYARQQSLVEDLALPVATNVTEQPSGTVSLSCGRGAVFGAIQGTIGKLQNDLKRPGFVDSESRNGSISLGYRSTTVGDLSVVGQYSRVAYSNAIVAVPLPTVPINPDFEQYAVGLQYARKIGMRLSGTASVSATRLQSAGAKNSGISANASLKYRATSRVELTLGYERGEQASILVNTSYLRAQSFNFEANYRLSQRIAFGAGVRSSNDRYRGGVPSPLQIRSSKQLSENINGSLKIGRNTQVVLSAAHVDRTADVSIYNFTSDNVSLGLTTQF